MSTQTWDCASLLPSSGAQLQYSVSAPRLHQLLEWNCLWGRWWHEPWAGGHLHTGHSDTVNSRLEQLTLCKGARPRLELSLCAVHRPRGLTAGSLSALWGMVTETPWCRWLTERNWYSSASPGLPGKQHRCACAAPEGCFLTRSSTFPW